MQSEKELGEVLKRNANTIEVEGDLVRKVFKIKATGKVAWGVCIAGIAVAVTSLILTASSAGTASFATVPSTLVAGTGVVSFWALLLRNLLY